MIPILLTLFPKNEILNKLLQVVATVVILYYPIHIYRVADFDYGIQRATESLCDIKKLNHLKTTKENKQKIYTIYTDGIALKERGIKTLYIGTTKYLYDYILENGKGYSLQEFHLPDENKLRENISPILINYGAVCLLIENSKMTDRYKNFIQWLNKNGYTYYVSGKNYLILHKIENQWTQSSPESQ